VPEVMMEGSFGARLRLQRERQQVPLATIADQTKIKIGLLEGLERDDVSHWPAGIFRRSYVRAYAQAIGLEPDQVVREFLSRYPDPFEDDTAVEAVARAVDGTTRRPPMRLTYLISSAIKALPRRSGSVAKAVADVPQKSASEEWLSQEFSGDALPGSGLAHPMTLDPAHPASSSADSFGEDLAFSPAEPEVGRSHGDPAYAMTAAYAMTEALLPGHAHDDVAQPALFELSPPPPPEPAHHPPSRGLQDEATDAAIGTVADLCTRLGRAEHATAVRMVVEDATSILGAIGLILWAWDEPGGALRPAVSHGYSEDMLAQVPPLPPESDNAIASAFRSAETRLVDGNDLETGALAVPLLAPFGCVGVLAAEFRNGGERRERARAILTILAAQLSMLIGQPPALRAAASA
jgi:hypothetical protein